MSPWPLWRKVYDFLHREEPPAEMDPEVMLIVQELDEWLMREHELIGEEPQTRDIGDLLRDFAQRCHKVALVGSRRRGKADPNDIDVLYIPKSNLQVMEFLERIADDEKYISKKEGCWTCTVNGSKIDFIESSSASWGMDMVIYTGSREFNSRMARHAERRGYYISSGRPMSEARDSYRGTWRHPAFDNWSEEKILVHLGLSDFLDPRKREISREPKRIEVLVERASK